MLTSITQTIQQLDEQLLLAINGTPEWAGELMWSASQTWVWIPLYLLVMLAVIRAGRRQGGWTAAFGGVLVLAATFGATDAISARIIKPGFERLRPSHAPSLEGQLILASRPSDGADASSSMETYRGGRYGFVSSHAANTFGLAAAFILLMGRARWLWGWAALVSWTRLYLGVHYATDILAGAVLGIGCAAALRTLHLRIQPAIINLRNA